MYISAGRESGFFFTGCPKIGTDSALREEFIPPLQAQTRRESENLSEMSNHRLLRDGVVSQPETGERAVFGVECRVWSWLGGRKAHFFSLPWRPAPESGCTLQHTAVVCKGGGWCGGNWTSDRQHCSGIHTEVTWQRLLIRSSRSPPGDKSSSSCTVWGFCRRGWLLPCC